MADITLTQPAEQRRLRTIVLVLGLLFLLAGPTFLSGYWVRVLTSIFMYTVVTCSINLIGGYGGYPAFGNVAFFGVGAYVAGVLGVRYNVPFPVAVVAGGAAATLLAAVLGPAILRIKGGYFAIATLGINEALKEIATNLSITGGGHGLSMPAFPWSPAVLFGMFYYIFMALMIACVLFTAWLTQVRFGYGLRALRFEEEAAEVMGVNTVYHKVAAWSISACMMALAGGLWAYYFAYIEPPMVFNIMIIVKGFVMMLLGGMGTVFGPVVGAFFLELLSEAIWGKFLNMHLLVLGSIIVVVAMFAPAGISTYLNSLKTWRQLIRMLGGGWR